ncbi:hypothetical protein SAMN04489740_4187 [Arthrobacter alpinus]|uniref:Uncharacterized protein n=1 Tax=Arthrobacter alpinus TaxID=656366 RepID=A0A1H5PDX2_9MICC|nr:hypothetical protein [Arthrobacter alpinus]SEF12119.1 hypothetical protein SAMN04489740_4187 [Arthrobacter alpinus]
MTTLVYLAMAGTADEFLAAYEGSGAAPTSLLLDALSHSDAASRVVKAIRLLDDGADATVVSNGNNAINVLLGQRDHEVEGEAAVLQRLIDGGADINHPDRRGAVPLLQILRMATLNDAEMVPYYDVIFARPGLDLDRPEMPKNTSEKTVRERIFASGGFRRVIMRERVLAYEAQHGS